MSAVRNPVSVRRRLIVLRPHPWYLILALALIASVLTTSDLSASADTRIGNVAAVRKCDTDRSHWYGRATNTTSKTSDTIGTGITTTMPGSYYAPKGSTDDEAGWIAHPAGLATQAPHSAFELGWFQGLWPYPGTDYGMQFSFPQGYETINNGAKGGVLTGALPKGHEVEFDSAAANFAISVSITEVKPKHLIFGADTHYKVSFPRENFSQGEVTVKKGAWMGGNDGKGSVLSGYYEVPPSGGGGFLKWHSFTMCDNSPYFIKSKGSNEWQNGGK